MTLGRLDPRLLNRIGIARLLPLRVTVGAISLTAILPVEVAILTVPPLLASPILPVAILVDAILLPPILLATILARPLRSLAVVGSHLAVPFRIVAIGSAAHPVSILALLERVPIPIRGALSSGLSIGIRLPLAGLTLLAIAAVGLSLLLAIGLTFGGIGLRWSRGDLWHERRRCLGRGETIGNAAVVVVLPFRIDGVGLAAVACLGLLSARNQPEIMFSMLQIAFGGDRITGRLRIPCQLQIFFGYMVSVAANLDVGTV